MLFDHVQKHLFLRVCSIVQSVEIGAVENLKNDYKKTTNSTYTVLRQYFIHKFRMRWDTSRAYESIEYNEIVL
jgi:hypothetical protein